MDAEELRRAIGGDKVAVHALVRELGPLLRHEVRRVRAGWVNPTIDEDDMVQEILAELFRDGAAALVRWDERKGRSLANYLRVFAFYRAHDLLSAPWRREQLASESDLAGRVESRALPSGGVNPADGIDEAARQYLQRCSEPDRRFFQRFLEAATPAELAKEFGISRGAVDQRIHRLRDAIRALLVKLD